MNYASILGIDKQPKDCTVEELRAAYKSSALANHPDKGGDAERFKMISEAYVKLMELKDAKGAKDAKDAKNKTTKRKREELREDPKRMNTGPMSAYVLLGIERYLKTDDGRRDPLATLLRMESARMKSAKKPLLSFDTSYIDRIAHDHIEKIRKNFLAKKDPKKFEDMEWANRRSES